MSFVRQFTVLVSACFTGEVLHALLPLPVPAAIYALVLMFLALELKIMPLQSIDKASSGLIEIMPLLFVPSTVGIIIAWPVLKKYAVPMVILGIAGTALNFLICGQVTQLVIRLSKKFEKTKGAENSADGESNAE